MKVIDLLSSFLTHHLKEPGPLSKQTNYSVPRESSGSLKEKMWPSGESDGRIGKHTVGGKFGTAWSNSVDSLLETNRNSACRI